MPDNSMDQRGHTTFESKMPVLWVTVFSYTFFKNCHSAVLTELGAVVDLILVSGLGFHV
jgi:hypothetical protein